MRTHHLTLRHLEEQNGQFHQFCFKHTEGIWLIIIWSSIIFLSIFEKQTIIQGSYAPKNFVFNGGIYWKKQEDSWVRHFHGVFEFAYGVVRLNWILQGLRAKQIDAVGDRIGRELYFVLIKFHGHSVKHCQNFL